MAKTTSDKNYVTSRRPRTGDPIVPGSVVYDTSNRVISIGYYIGFNNDIETVTFSYTVEGYLVFKGVEYRNYQFNTWEATLISISPAELEVARHAHTQVELKRASDLGLSLNNVVVGEDDMDLITMNNGELIFTPIIS